MNLILSTGFNTFDTFYTIFDNMVVAYFLGHPVY